jgi:hypothetical protein
LACIGDIAAAFRSPINLTVHSGRAPRGAASEAAGLVAQSLTRRRKQTACQLRWRDVCRWFQ